MGKCKECGKYESDSSVIFLGDIKGFCSYECGFLYYSRKSYNLEQQLKEANKNLYIEQGYTKGNRTIVRKNWEHEEILKKRLNDIHDDLQKIVKSDGSESNQHILSILEKHFS